MVVLASSLVREAVAEVLLPGGRRLFCREPTMHWRLLTGGWHPGLKSRRRLHLLSQLLDSLAVSLERNPVSNVLAGSRILVGFAVPGILQQLFVILTSFSCWLACL